MEDGESGCGQPWQTDRRIPRQKGWNSSGDWHSGSPSKEESGITDKSRETRGDPIRTQEEEVSDAMSANP